MDRHPPLFDGALGLAPPPPGVARPGLFQLTVQGMVLPMWAHLAFNGLGWLAGALLGHPYLAAMGFVLTSLADAAFQARIARWRAKDIPAEADFLFPKLAWCCAGRAAVILLAPTLVALNGGMFEMAYFGSVIGSLAVVGVANGLLSGAIILSYAAPTLTAAAIVVLARMHGAPALGVAIGFLSLALLLAMIGAGVRIVIGQWHDAHNASRALAADLAKAHALAVAEKIAAEAAREEARQAHSAKANFLATMSHEIRTPMNGVLGMANLLMRGESDPRQKERIATLIQSGEYLLGILNDILDVSKIDAGKLELVERPEALAAFLRETIRFWAPKAEEKGVRLELDLGEGAPDTVKMDALRVRQILFNLIGNALKFTEAGKVVCKVDARDIDPGRSCVHLVVSDTGPGVHPDHLSTLFEQFAQGDASSVRRFGGTGLGLTIARQLVDLMGGRIWVESELGRGADFHVELPLTRAVADAPDTTADVSASEAEVQPLDLLIVDDNKINLLVLTQLLSIFDHRVTQAEDGPQALAELALRPFDLVIMDVQMPGMTGIEALQTLRATEGPNQQVPVIALTADVVSGDREKYLSMGFTEHGTKPIQVEQLFAAIASAMARTSQTAVCDEAVMVA